MSGSRRTIGVAIAIPEPYGGELRDHRESFGDPLAKSIPTHVTLLPPTEVDTEALPAIEDHLRAIAEAEVPFVMRLSGTGTFRPISPVVFVAVAEGAATCERIAARVRSGPLRRDLRFPYHPHVTVAHDLPDQDLDRACKVLADYQSCFSVWGFSLYEHGPDGVWRPQRDFPFEVAVPGPRPGQPQPAELVNCED